MNILDVLANPFVWVGGTIGGMFLYREASLIFGDYYGAPGWAGRWTEPPTIVVASPDGNKAKELIKGIQDVIKTFSGNIVMSLDFTPYVPVAHEQVPRYIIVSCMPEEELGQHPNGSPMLGWTTVVRRFANGDIVPDDYAGKESLPIVSARCRINFNAPFGKLRASVRHELCHALGNGKHDPYPWSPMGVNVVNRQLTPRDVRTTMKGYHKIT